MKVQHIISDTIRINDLHQLNITLDGFVDTVKLTLCYQDKTDKELSDTLIINNQKTTSNVHQLILDNISNINLDISCALCDSFFIRKEIKSIYNHFIDTLNFVVISDSTVFVIDKDKDSIRGYYENDNFEIFFKRIYQYGDTVNYTYSDLNTSTDTITAYRDYRRFSHYDTISHVSNNDIQYSISYYTIKNVQLPVSLSHFSVCKCDKNACVNFETAGEFNNSHFEIQRSLDGKDFETIYFVEGKGTTLETQNYSFVDSQLENGTTYYRLKQIDFDGQFEYSDIKSVYIETNKNIIKQYGYKLEIAGNGQLLIFNAIGQKVKDISINEFIEIDLSNLKSGVYFLRFNNQTTKMIKQ